MDMSNPEQYAADLIRNKNTRNKKNIDIVLTGLIGDSFNVNFSANTNNGGNATGHRKFAQAVPGTVMANVAPNLDLPIFKNIFFKQESSNLDEKIKAFYGISHDSKYIKLPDTALELNETAYKKHFEIWAENTVAAAKKHGATQIVIPGMGLGIYAGALQNNEKALATLADLQFVVLQNIAKNNQGLHFIFCGLGQEPSQLVEVPSNLEGRLFNDLKPMIQEGKPNQMRVVAGSFKIPLGGGYGDNGQIDKDTNAAAVRGGITHYSVNSTIISVAQLSVSLQNPAVQSSVSSQALRNAYDEVIKALSKLQLQSELKDIKKSSLDVQDYVQIKKVIRTLKNMNFSRFKGDERFQEVIAAENKFKDALEQAKNNARPSFAGIITICWEWCKDILSFLKRYFSADRKWVDSIKNAIDSHKQIN